MTTDVLSLNYWHRRSKIAATMRRLSHDHASVLSFLWHENDLPGVYDLNDPQADHAEALLRQLDAGDYDAQSEVPA
jgi:hypothetical protein